MHGRIIYIECQCIRRDQKSIEPDICIRLEELVRIGIDETSYRSGGRYMTVVVKFETCKMVWVRMCWKTYLSPQNIQTPSIWKVDKGDDKITAVRVSKDCVAVQKN